MLTHVFPAHYDPKSESFRILAMHSRDFSDFQVSLTSVVQLPKGKDGWVLDLLISIIPTERFPSVWLVGGDSIQPWSRPSDQDKMFRVFRFQEEQDYVNFENAMNGTRTVTILMPTAEQTSD